MKTRALLLLISAQLVCFPSYAASYNYDVSGTDSNGNAVSGDVDAYRGSRMVDGTIQDENGESVQFSGEWVGHGEIEGIDENGNNVSLEVD